MRQLLAQESLDRLTISHKIRRKQYVPGIRKAATTSYSVDNLYIISYKEDSHGLIIKERKFSEKKISHVFKYSSYDLW